MFEPVTMPCGQRMAWLMLAVLMALTVLVYWPSLYGGYIFDDQYYLDQSDIHVRTLHLGEWVKAALSQTGANQFRALSMLSFAANYYLTGMDPFWLKLTNVGIHLINGLLLFLLLRELFGLCVLARNRRAFGQFEDRLGLIAAMIAGGWLLLPINLTGVAYVSQRLESLANVFVFLGLYWYLNARRREYAGQSNGAMLWTSLVVCLALGFSAKESAALLPLYTACAEFAITGFRNRDGRFSRPALQAHFVFLILPLIAGVAWISTWIARPITAFRTFTTGERLLTESRVLVDYIHWTLLPNLNELTFFHDDLAISHGLLNPPTTLLAIMSLLTLLGIAVWQRGSRPLFCVGILWFFGGHAMTATVIPLEMVFEHRNYFPSMGLLLATTSLLAMEPRVKYPVANALIAMSFVALFGFTTFLRAEEWSNPLRFAYAEALKRPESPRAQYELARTLIMAAGSKENSPLIDESTRILERSAYLPNTGIAPLQALIFLAGRAHRDVDPRWWQAIVDKLQKTTPSQTDIQAVLFLHSCQQRGECPLQIRELFDTFTAALTKSQGNITLMAAYADFAFRDLDDPALAERMARDVVAARPQIPEYHANLLLVLIATAQFDKTDPEFATLQQLNHLGSLDTMIAQLRAKLAEAVAALANSGAGPAGIPEPVAPSAPDVR